MKRRGWQKVETRMARDIGAANRLAGNERGGGDFAHGPFCYQLKVRAAIPGWLRTWLAGIVGTAGKQGQTGVLVLKHPNERDDNAVVVLRWADWVAWHGAIPATLNTPTQHLVVAGEHCSPVRSAASGRPDRVSDPAALGIDTDKGSSHA